MKNTKIISWVLLSTLALTASVWAYNYNNTENNNFQKTEFNRVWNFKNMDSKLTTEEKTALENMTQEEKIAFFEAKREENQKKHEARENVIDKLLAWSALTSDEEVIKAEIIKQRAERKAEMEAKKLEMEKIKTIMEKKKAWSELTDEEQKTLDDFKANNKQKMWNKKGKMWWKQHFEKEFN